MPSGRAIVFDLWDTLTDPTAQLDRRRVVSEVGQLLGADGDAFATLTSETFGERCRGELGGLEATLRHLCARLGVAPTAEQLHAAVEHRLRTQAQLLRWQDDAASTLARFRAAGWKVGLLTDSTCETEQLWPGGGLAHLFDAVAFSCAEGCSKPDPAFYRMVLDQLGVDPTATAYAADGLNGELAAAHALGMRAVRVGPSPPPPHGEEWAGESVPTLTSLANLLLQ